MSPRTAQQFAQMRDERRDEILRAALGVFARRGFEATRIADIAEAANMSHGLIYRYFPSKEAAFVALVERAVQGGSELTEQALAGKASPRDRLATVIQQMLEGIRTDPEYPLIIVHAYAAGTVPAEAARLLDDYGKRTHRNIAGLIRQAQAAGEVRSADADELATLILAAIQGLAVDRLEVHTRRRRFPRAQTIINLLQP
jgi:AcrR family transcriptional regulator